MSLPFLVYRKEAQPGKALKHKASRSAERTSEIKKKYESNQERKFLEEWKENKDIPDVKKWLQYDASQEKMFCSWCVQYVKNQHIKVSCSFVDGCQNFKIKSIKDHAISKVHEKSKPVKKDLDVRQTEAGSCILKLKQADYSK